MASELRHGDPTTPTGEFEFKIRSLISEDLNARKRRHSLTKLLHLVEKNMIVDALERVDGNQKAAGHALGLKYTTFCAKLKRYGIKVIRHFGVHS
jgi:transcriptional regulator with GAF, ATPase, and Fis domain